VQCGETVGIPRRAGLQSCYWHGLHPQVVPDGYAALSKGNKSVEDQPYSRWVEYNVTSTNSTASFSFKGLNTKQCRLVFDRPAKEVRIDGAPTDPHFKTVSDDRTYQVRLFSRTWDKLFNVNVTWPKDQAAKGQTGKIMCMWSDANQLGTIPAYDEIRRFEPFWSAVTKGDDGLVEGWKSFEI